MSDKVSKQQACPKCRERRMDRLIWTPSGELVRCQTCRKLYKPKAGLSNA